MNEWLATWLWSCSRSLVIKSDEFIPFSLFEGWAQVKKTRISILCFLINTTPSVSRTYITLSFFLSILISPATLVFTLPKSVRKNSFNIGSMDQDQQREWCSSLTSVYTFIAPWTSFPSFALGPLLRKILWINKRPSNFPCINNSLLSTFDSVLTKKIFVFE